MTNDLSWANQVDDISKKVFGSLRRFRSFDRALSLDVRICLISAMVTPYIDYCCLLHLDNTTVLDLILQRAFNACIRFIFKLRKYTHITPYLTRLGWLNIRKRRFYFLGSLIYQIKATQKPLCLISSIHNPPCIITFCVTILTLSTYFLPEQT